METKKFIFNRTDLVLGNTIEKPTDNEIENTPCLRQASIETALRYGGSLTRRAINAMNLRFDRKYIVVDTKVHLLMKGWCPSIPGWHTDGVPRGEELNPAGTGLPNMFAQEGQGITSPRFHLMVCGDNSLTLFLNERNVELAIPEKPTRDLYAEITGQVNQRVQFNDLSLLRTPECRVVEWDWWELHSAEWAIKRGWRYLIRVTETDYIKPREDLNDILRFQNMVFVKSDEIGW